MGFTVTSIKALEDNYIYILIDNDSNDIAVIDPGDSSGVLEYIEEEEFRLTDIFITHHHHDHTGGIGELYNRYGCRVSAPRRYARKIPETTQTLDEGDEIVFAGERAYIWALPGHTLDHIVYWFREANILFCGDVLFSLGCGRIFEGTPKKMWENMLRLRLLDDDTLIYCSHEYSLTNALFTASIDNNNPVFQERFTAIKGLLSEGKSTIPFRLGDEKLANVFLRADDYLLKSELDMHDKSDAAVFTYLRSQRDKFKPSASALSAANREIQDLTKALEAATTTDEYDNLLDDESVSEIESGDISAGALIDDSQE